MMIFDLLIIFIALGYFALVLILRKSLCTAEQIIINTKNHSLAVIIPARNEEQSIRNVLDDLLTQSYQEFTAYIVDDRSTDRTSEIVGEYQKKSDKLKLIRINETPTGFASKKYAIHTAIQAAREEIIVTTDADCRLSKDWLQAINQSFDEQTGFLFGYVKFVPFKNNYLNNWQSFDYFVLMCAAAATVQMGYPFAAAAANLAYRRQLYLEIGGFGPLAHRISGDDVLLMQRFRQLTNKKIKFMKSGKGTVSTQTEPTWRQFFRQRMRWASNSSIQWKLNIFFFTFLAGIYGYNLIIFFLPVILIVKGLSIYPWIVLLLLKYISENLFLKTGSQIFENSEKMKFFPIWFLTHPLYIIVIGLVGQIGKIKWK